MIKLTHKNSQSTRVMNQTALTMSKTKTVEEKAGMKTLLKASTYAFHVFDSQLRSTNKNNRSSLIRRSLVILPQENG